MYKVHTHTRARAHARTHARTLTHARTNTHTRARYNHASYRVQHAVEVCGLCHPLVHGDRVGNAFHRERDDAKRDGHGRLDTVVDHSDARRVLLRTNDYSATELQR